MGMSYSVIDGLVFIVSLYISLFIYSFIVLLDFYVSVSLCVHIMLLLYSEIKYLYSPG